MFAKIEKKHRKAGVTISVSRAGKSLRTTVAFPESTYAYMGYPKKVESLVGNGDDRGRLMLRPSDEGYAVRRIKDRYNVILPNFSNAEDTYRAQETNVDLEDTALIIDLPDYME